MLIQCPEAGSSAASSVVSSTPIASTSNRSALLKAKTDSKPKPKQLEDESFGLGDSLDNISWDRLDKDLNKINESHTEKGDISMKNLSTISTDLVNNRCSSPDLIRESDVSSSRSEYASKRSSSPSPSGKTGERLHKRERHFSGNSNVSLINSDNSLFTDETSSDPFLSDESIDSSVFAITQFKEVKVGEKFTFIVIDGTNASLIADMTKKFAKIKTFSIHFTTELKNQNPLQVIGSKIRILKTQTQEINGLDMNHNNTVLTSLAVCFESENDVYYITGSGLKAIRDELKKCLKCDSKVITFDAKMCYKILRQCFGLEVQKLIQMDWFDLQIAQWVLDPECVRPKNVQELVKIRAKAFYHLFGAKNSRTETDCISTGLMFPVINSLMSELEDKNQLKAYKKTEMPSRLTIADMELNGIAVDLDYMNKILDLLNQTKRQLEEKAFEVANHKFKLSSPQEVAKVLYEELNLLSNYYSVQKSSQKASAKVEYKRKLPKHLSTSKSALKKLLSLSKSPMPQIILDWRRVNAAIKKNIKPILSYYSLESKTGVRTINGVSDDWTSTGRIVMCEPNIIGTVKDFTIDGITFEEEEPNQTITFSVRKCFVAQKGCQLVSADYSQLELRILAHLSKDKRLTKVLNSGGDVFKSIASVWRSKPIEEITDEERQQSKQVVIDTNTVDFNDFVSQIVYGMIYGKGEKSLAEDLEVTEAEAKDFMDSFIGRYEGVKQFIAKTIEECREKGYCETLSGRRRYLPHIQSQNMALRAKAERQAVNSTIQGSAADLVKTAMAVLQMRLLDDSPRIESRFVLQMYDELMYEVSESSAEEFARLLAECMQTCLKNFRVELPVRVKVGPNWAQLKPFEDIL